MKASEAIRQAIDNGSEINAYGAYLIALKVEADDPDDPRP